MDYGEQAYGLGALGGALTNNNTKPSLKATKVEVKDALTEVRHLMDDVLFSPEYVAALERVRVAQVTVDEFSKAISTATAQIEALKDLILAGEVLTVVRSTRGAILLARYEAPAPINIKDLEQ